MHRKNSVMEFIYNEASSYLNQIFHLLFIKILYPHVYTFRGQLNSHIKLCFYLQNMILLLHLKYDAVNTRRTLNNQSEWTHCPYFELLKYGLYEADMFLTVFIQCRTFSLHFVYNCSTDTFQHFQHLHITVYNFR